MLNHSQNATFVLLTPVHPWPPGTGEQRTGYVNCIAARNYRNVPWAKWWECINFTFGPYLIITWIETVSMLRGHPLLVGTILIINYYRVIGIEIPDLCSLIRGGFRVLKAFILHGCQENLAVLTSLSTLFKTDIFIFSEKSCITNFLSNLWSFFRTAFHDRGGWHWVSDVVKV